MISPIQLGSPAKAVLYHKDLLASADVDTLGVRQYGEWIGRGAEMLNLAGVVGEKQFKNVLSGMHPETGEKLTARIDKDRRSGMDYTIAPPKGVSVACLVLGDVRIRGVLKTAEMAAVKVFEDQAAARVRTDGDFRGERTTGNLIIAKFDHLTARPAKEGGTPDPHLHTHLCIVNMTHDEVAGGYRALETHQMLESQALADAVYCHELAKGLRELGYDIRKKGKQFEIAGISDAIVDKFSKRHVDIVERTKMALAAGKGKNEKAVAAIVAHAGRANKDTKSDLATLQQAWMGQLTESERKELLDLRENVLYREAKMQGSPTLMSPKQYEAEFTRLHATIQAAEKTPDRQMSPEEITLWNKDWREFSRSRGYTEQEIIDYQRWLDLHGDLSSESFSNLDPVELHKQIVAGAIKTSKPVSAEAVETYGISLPEGYVLKGKHFVREISEREALDWSVAHCFERGSVVKPQMLLEEALRYAAGSERVSRQGLELLLKEDKRFIWSKKDDRLTTQTVAGNERVIINMVREGVGQHSTLAKNIPEVMRVEVTPDEAKKREDANREAAEKRDTALRAQVRILAAQMGVKLPRVPKVGKDLDLNRLLSHFSDDQRETVIKAAEKKLPAVKRDCDLSIDQLCSKFSEPQRAAALKTVESRDFLTVFRGGAGRGKSYALIFVEKLLEREGANVIVAAPQTGQVCSLTQDRGRPAITVASLLAMKQPLEHGTVLLVDEAGQIGTKTMRDLLLYAKMYDARVILSGDPKQHASVESGDAFRAIIKYTKATYADLGTEVDAIKRQKERWFRGIVALAEEGKPGESFARLEKLDAFGRGIHSYREGVVPLEKLDAAVREWIEKHPDDKRIPDKARIFEFKAETLGQTTAERDEKRRRAVAEKAVELFVERENIKDEREKQKHSTLVISQTRKEVAVLNEYIRDGLIKAGVLGGEERVVYTLDPTNFTTAEKVLPESFTDGVVMIAGAEILPDKSKSPLIPKGTILKFAGIENKKIVVTTMDGERHVIGKRDMKCLTVGKLVETPLRVGDLLRLRETLHVGIDHPGKPMPMPDGTKRKYTHKRRIANGSIVKVVGWDEKGQMIIESVLGSSKMRATLTRPILANRGYSCTSYSAQGQTVKFVLYSDSGSKGATSSRQWYVDISRAKEGVWVYTNDREGLRKRIQVTGERELATEMLEEAQRGNLVSNKPESPDPKPDDPQNPKALDPATPDQTAAEPTEADLFMDSDEKKEPEAFSEPEPVIEGTVTSEIEPDWEDVHSSTRTDDDDGWNTPSSQYEHEWHNPSVSTPSSTPGITI
jgi:conjugative relaxase-like TrwC/TraI family protein